MGEVDLRRFPDANALARTAARDWLDLVADVCAKQPVFCVALAGGRIAQNFLAEAANLWRGSHVPEGVHFFWSDERCVPPEDSESNFRLANEALLLPLQVPSAQVHRIEGERAVQEACGSAERTLRSVASAVSGSQPVLDLVLLGMGEDGHVASLFPEEAATAMADPAVLRGVKAVKPPPQRITFGYPVIAAARRAWVLASGAGKQRALQASLAPDGDTPLARVLRLRTNTRIYTDLQI